MRPRARAGVRCRHSSRAVALFRAVLLSAGTIVAAGPWTATAQPGARPARLLVMPFESDSRQPRTYWLGEGASMLVADELTALGVPVLTRDQRVRAFETLHLPQSATLTRATVIRAGQLVGADQVMFGRVAVEGTTVVLRARQLRLDAGQWLPEITERGEVADLVTVCQRLARRLAPGPGGGAPPPGPAVAGEAFESYVKGLLAEDPASRIRLFRAALARQPGYDRALLALWTTHTELGDHAAALAAARSVTESSPRARHARFDMALSSIELRQYDEAFALLKALADAQPSAAVLNNLGIVQLRRGSMPQTGRATYYFTKATEADGDDGSLFFNLGYAYWQERDTQACVYWLREAVRRDPADGDAHYVLAAALAVAGSATEAAREKELAHRLSARYEEWDRRSATAGDPVPRNLERIKREWEPLRTTRFDAGVTNAAQRDQRELAVFYLERGRRLFEQQKDGEAATELRRALFLSPYQADALLLLGRIYLRSGRPREAADALRVSLWSQETAAAHVALGEALLDGHDLAGAREEATRALTLDPGSADAKALLARIDDAQPR